MYGLTWGDTNEKDTCQFYAQPHRCIFEASKCFSPLGINITRVSYNKAVDSHTLFIDAEGTDEQLKKAGICKAMQTNPALFLLSFVLKTFPAASRTF